MNVGVCVCVSVCCISQWRELAGMHVFSEVYKMLGSLVYTVFFFLFTCV